MWKKVVAPTVFVSLIWGAASCGTWTALSRLDESQTSLLNHNRNVIQAAGTMQECLWRLQAELLQDFMLLEKQAEWREQFNAEVARIENAFEAALSRASENTSTADERRLTDAIGGAFHEFRSFSHGQFAQDDRSPEETAKSVEKAMQLAQAVAKPSDELSQLAQCLTSEAFQRRDDFRGTVNATRVGFMIVGPALGILFGLWVARGLHHSISEISVTLRGASGDLEQHIGSVELHPAGELDGLPALQRQVQVVSSRIKQVLEELVRTRQEAVRAERLAAAGELATGVAHELRNPLTSVKLLIQAVRRGQLADSPDAERLSFAEQEVIRMETTIRELLDFARPPKLHRVRHDVRDTVRRAITLVAGRAQSDGVTIEECLGAAPATVDADAELLIQVFVNLLLNAIEAMADGGSLHVSVERQSGDPVGMLRIVFRDTGDGIPEQIMSRIFEPFVTSKERGVGLGLAISRRIMQEHAGRLTATNPPLGGATFVAELPLADLEFDGGAMNCGISGMHVEQIIETARSR